MSNKTVSETFSHYSKRLLKFILGKVHLLEDAEDILSEVFYQYSRVSGLANPIENVAAWLYRSARNRIIDHYKKKKETPLPAFYDDEEDGYVDYVIDEIADVLFGEAAGPETDYLRSLILREIETAVAELPKEQREVFELSELYDMPVKEIARKTGAPLNTVLSRKHYAVMYLRKRLRELYSDVMSNENSLDTSFPMILS